MLYSVLEQHEDGSWWYHPWMGSFATPEEAEEKFKACFWHDPDRPHMIFKHNKPLPQDHSTCTLDFEGFEFGGIAEWTNEKGGE